MIKLKRAYTASAPEDDRRFLVDRVWPRGIRRDAADIEAWVKEAGPSTELRKWFGHDPERWTEFQKRYRQELKNKSDLLAHIKELEKEHGSITLVFSARDEERNQAVVLRDFLAKRPGKSKRKRARKKVGG